MEKIGVYAGTFDPITNGHIDIVHRALEIFDKIYVTIAINPSKKTFFTIEERLKMIKEIFKDNPAVEVYSFTGLIIDFVKQTNATAIIRGIRAVTDFEYEFQMALMNRKMSPKIETVFLLPREEYSYLNSTIVKQLAQFNAPIDCLVPKIVKDMLIEKMRNNHHLS